jgi:ceramide glucosyltransferase
MSSNALIDEVLIVLSAIALLISLISHAAAHVKLSRRPSRDAPAPPISILKPLAGLDDGLFENLAALAHQDYPDFEIILGTESADDPALAVARRFQASFPHVPIRIVTSARTLGRNPKVNNLASIASHARHELILISDSNVRPNPLYLRETASELRDPNVGLVANVIAGTGEETIGALFENLHLNSFVAGGICAAQLLASHVCVVGKSMLFRKGDLQSLGGWRGVRNVLAEDYVLGRRFSELGRRVVISTHVLPTLNERWEIKRFFNRHVRWGQMRRRIAPLAFFLEPLLNPIPLLAAAIATTQTAPISAAAFGGIVLKCASDALLAKRLRNNGFSLVDLAWIPVKDLLVVLIWLTASVRRTVTWRGNVLRIGPQGRLLRVRPRWLIRRRARGLAGSR